MPLLSVHLIHNIMIALTFENYAVKSLMLYIGSFNIPGGDDDFVEGDWDDEEDEDFDDQMEDEDDLNEIRVGDDVYEPDPDPDDDDHLPDDDLQ